MERTFIINWILPFNITINIFIPFIVFAKIAKNSPEIISRRIWMVIVFRIAKRTLERVKVPDVHTYARVSVFWHWALGLEGLGWYRGHRCHHYRTAAADPRLWRIAWPARSRDQLPQKVWATRRVHIALLRASSSSGPAKPLYTARPRKSTRITLRDRNRK